MHIHIHHAYTFHGVQATNYFFTHTHTDHYHHHHQQNKQIKTKTVMVASLYFSIMSDTTC